jgi:RPEL repeat
MRLTKEREKERSALRKLLDAFLGRRPTKLDLIDKNILPEEEGLKKLDVCRGGVMVERREG